MRVPNEAEPATAFSIYLLYTRVILQSHDRLRPLNLVLEKMGGYILYSLTFSSFLLATGKSHGAVLPVLTNFFSALYLTRSRWAHIVPIPDYVYSRLHSSFSNDIESGFTSTEFDLSSNIAAGDSRAGLDHRGKKEVQGIMKSRKVGFDEARRLYTERNFAKNNIGPDGRPTDPKFVSFS